MNLVYICPVDDEFVALTDVDDFVINSVHHGPNMKYAHTAIMPETINKMTNLQPQPIGQQQNAILVAIPNNIAAPRKKKIHFVHTGITVVLSAATETSKRKSEIIDNLSGNFIYQKSWKGIAFCRFFSNAPNKLCFMRYSVATPDPLVPL